jgi:hypothetical protein
MTDGQQVAIKADASTELALDRTLLAHERTTLTWIRTATALVTFGFQRPPVFRIARQGTERADRLVGPTEFVFAMINRLTRFWLAITPWRCWSAPFAPIVPYAFKLRSCYPYRAPTARA